MFGFPTLGKNNRAGFANDLPSFFYKVITALAQEVYGVMGVSDGVKLHCGTCIAAGYVCSWGVVPAKIVQEQLP